MKVSAILLVTLFVTEQPQTPRQIADELLAADRAFAAAGAKTDLITGISALFATDVAMPAPGGIVYGSAKAVETLKANPANVGARAEWWPARVGLSADGKHGFTAGFMSITRADGSTGAAKYMAYWEKQKDGWRALAYKRGAAKAVPPAAQPTYLLPPQIVSSGAVNERDRESLADAERSFSKDAQTMGLGAAFKKYGSPDAMNFGGPDAPAFVMGNEAISQIVGNGDLNWGPEKALIAPSGDFGVTIGYIFRNQPGADPSTSSGQGGPPRAGQPFFTIWRRDTPGSPWRYIAE